MPNLADEELLDAVLERDDLSDKARAAFEDMQHKLTRYGKLSDGQRAWASAASRGERYVPEEQYENLVSEGKVPRGREVELLVRDKPSRR